MSNNKTLKKSTVKEKNPSKLWWLFAIIILMVCILVQLPASWVVQKVMPNNSYLQWVSGNLWQGNAQWQLPPTNNKQPLSGNVNWQWNPLKILLGKFSADIHITSAQTRLQGEVTAGLSSWEVQDLSGSIHPTTINSFIDWEIPDAPIKVNKLLLEFDKEAGFEEAEGQITWVGGQLGYPQGGQVILINLPAMRADISTEDKEGITALHVRLVNQENKNLGDFYLDAKGMLDVSLTQRLLENVPSYTGSAPKDTAVVSLRQPIKSLGK